MIRLLLLIVLPTVTLSQESTFVCQVPQHMTMEMVSKSKLFQIPENSQKLSYPFFQNIKEGMSIYQVIPYRTLRNFYNAVLDSVKTNTTQEVIQFGEFLENLVNTTNKRFKHEVFSKESHNASFAFSNAIKNYGSKHPLGMTNWQIEEGFMYVTSLFTWLPGNLFVGPSDRNNSTRSDSDAIARNVIDPAQYARLTALNTMMEAYISHKNQAPFTSLIDGLNKVINHTAAIYPFNANQWSKNQSGSKQDEHQKLRKRSTENITDDFEMSDDGSCRGIHRSKSFRCNDKTACRFARSALLFDSECILVIENSGLLQTIKFKEPTADQWKSRTGSSGPPSLNDYNISGRVQNVIYNVLDKVCFIAIDDSRHLYGGRLHKTLDGDICHIGVNARIMDVVVVMQARPQVDPNVQNQVLSLNLKDLCF